MIFVIYILIGFSFSVAVEVWSNRNLTFAQRVVAVVGWPVILLAVLFGKFLEWL